MNLQTTKILINKAIKKVTKNQSMARKEVITEIDRIGEIKFLISITKIESCSIKMTKMITVKEIEIEADIMTIEKMIKMIDILIRIEIEIAINRAIEEVLGIEEEVGDMKEVEGVNKVEVEVIFKAEEETDIKIEVEEDTKIEAEEEVEVGEEIKLIKAVRNSEMNIIQIEIKNPSESLNIKVTQTSTLKMRAHVDKKKIHSIIRRKIMRGINTTNPMTGRIDLNKNSRKKDDQSTRNLIRDQKIILMKK